MNTLKPEVIKTLIDFRSNQIALAEEYHSKKQYETAFIAYWSILETFAKTVATEFHKCLRSFGFDSSQFWKVMDSKGECRTKHNHIAHSVEKFSSPTKYEELKLPAIELITSTYERFK